MAEWAADTARDQLATLGIGAPHATTLARVLQLLDADALDQLAGAWAQSLAPVAAIAIDGKEVRGAKNGGGTRIHLLAGIDHTTGAVLVQQNVSEKHNEITYFKPLLEGIKNLQCVVISADALHTQPLRRTSAPRGALSHSRRRRDRLEGRSAGSNGLPGSER